jgi:hypothetical protein
MNPENRENTADHDKDDKTKLNLETGQNSRESATGTKTADPGKIQKSVESGKQDKTKLHSEVRI